MNKSKTDSSFLEPHSKEDQSAKEAITEEKSPVIESGRDQKKEEEKVKEEPPEPKIESEKKESEASTTTKKKTMIVRETKDVKGIFPTSVEVVEREVVLEDQIALA